MMTTAVSVAQSEQNQQRLMSRLDKLTNWLMVAIIAIPFVISAGSLTVLAAENHISFPLLYPLMIDGGLLIFKALVLRSSLHGRRDWYSWGAAATLTGISVLLNVLHVPDTAVSPWLARFMAAMPPLVILGAFVAISRRVEETAQAQGVQLRLSLLAQEQAALDTAVSNLRTEQTELDTAVEDKRSELRRLVQEGQGYLDKLQGQIGLAEAQLGRLQQGLAVAPLSTKGVTAVARVDSVPGTVAQARGVSGEAGSDKLAVRRELVQELVQQGVSPKEMADSLGVSVKTIKRDIKVMNNE